MKVGFFLMAASALCLSVACSKDDEGAISTNSTVEEAFVGVADDGSFDWLIERGPMNPEAFKELNETLGINLDDIVPNTIEIFTYSAESYNREFSLTMNLRSLGHSSYFVLIPKGGKPATLDVMRVPFGSELGKMISQIFNSKKKSYSTKDAEAFGKWVTVMIEEGFVVTTGYDKKTGTYYATAYTPEEWEEEYGSAKSANKVKYYDCTK